MIIHANKTERSFRQINTECCKIHEIRSSLVCVHITLFQHGVGGKWGEFISFVMHKIGTTLKKYTRKDIKIIKPGPEHERLVDSIDLSVEAFRKNLISAATLARDFSQEYVLEELPEKLKFIVLLGQSYDGNPLDDGEVIYPEDYKERERHFDLVDDVVNLLWRNGWVPEWINIQVRKEDSTFTYIELVCCGRFSNYKHHIYHAHEGRAPFHVVGPPLPLGYRESEKFSLYWRENA